MAYIIPVMTPPPPPLKSIKGGRKGPRTPRGPSTLTLVIPEPKVSDT